MALGGDGWMLHAGRITAEAGVPVLGVNLGRLGFLAEVQPFIGTPAGTSAPD